MLRLFADNLLPVFGWSRPLTAAVVLVVLLPNAGNLGCSPLTLTPLLAYLAG